MSHETQTEQAEPAPRPEPRPPFKEHDLQKPGLESEVEPRPRFEAPGYKPAGKLEGMVALVTGGDSGIGRAIAVLYAKEGADVAIVYLPQEEEDAQTVREAVEAEGRQALLLAGDVGDDDFCKEAVRRTVEELGGLDILVNNAAFQEHQDEPEDVTTEQWRRTFRTNIDGPFYLVTHALPHMGPGASIVNCSSLTGVRGNKELIDYSATKGALNAFTQSLAQMLMERGIRVNAVAPGPVWTPLNPADHHKDVSDFGANYPIGRPAQPEEIAPAFVFLASPADSSYISGIVLNISGGKTTG